MKSIHLFIAFWLILPQVKSPLFAQNDWQQDSIRFFELWREHAEIEEAGRIAEKSMAIKKQGLALSKKLLAEKFDSTIYTMHVSHYFGIAMDHNALGNIEEAIIYSDTAIQLLKDQFGPDYIGLENYYIQRGSSLFEKEDYDKALALNQQVLQLINKHQTDSIYWFDYDSLVFRWFPYSYQFHLSKYHSNTAKIYEDMGKLELAGKHNQAFLAISEELGVAPTRLISGMDRRGSIHLSLGQFEEAKNDFQAIQELIEEKLSKYRIPNLYARLRMANVYAYMGKDNMADQWLEGVFPLPDYSEMIRGQHITFIICLQTMADAYVSRKMYTKAVDFAQQAWAISNHFYGPANDRSLHALSIVTESYLEMAQLDSAMLYALKNFKAIVPKIDLQSAPKNPVMYPLAIGFHLPTTISQYAQVQSLKFNQSGDISELENALPYHHLSTKIIDAIRRDYFTSGSKQILISRAIELYEGAVETALKLYEQTNDPQHLETAFSFAEKSKSVLLLESVQGSKAQSFAGVPQALLNREKDLKIDIAFYGKRTYDEQNKKKPDPEKVNRWEERSLQLRNEYDSLLIVFQQDYPDYYQLKYDIQYATVEEIRNYLPDEHTACIEYFWGKENLYAFLITKDKVDCIRKPLSEEMDSHLEAFTKLLNRPDLGSPETYANHAGYLYDFLLRDVLTDTKVEHLVIIPDGRLGYLPFQVLIDNRQLEGLEDYRKLPYVINNYEVRYEYSSTLLLAEHTPKKQRGGFLGFAPKYGDEGTGISVRAAVEEDILADEDGGEVMRLASLQYTQTEVEEISHLFTGQSHIGNLATEAAFKSEASKHSILHLAMHAHTSDENPMYSRLIFQQGASEGGEDGMLYAYELYNMNLQAELAVLSACETGTGKLQNGEGIMSLSRAFKYAGCPNIVMSLWQADDASTKDIMVQFYENLKKGMGKAEALRKAKTKYLSETGFNKSHPFYWATFVLAGDDESVQME